MTTHAARNANVNTMQCSDTLRHILSYLEYPDTCSLRASNKELHALKTSRDAFEHARTLVHRPWISPGRCVLAECKRLKSTSYLDGVPYTLSNYCYGH